MLTFLQGSIDGAKKVLTGGQLDADVLRGIAVVLANLREDDGTHQVALKARAHGFLVLFHHARVEELVQFQSLTHLLAQGVTTSLPLLLIII